MDGGAPRASEKTATPLLPGLCRRVGGDHYRAASKKRIHIAYVQEAVKKPGWIL
jgi:hypothetical protein